MASSRSLFASGSYDSHSDTALDAVRREKILASSQNILAAAMDSSVSKFPFLQGDDSLMLEHWIELGEENMAELMEKVYGTEPWTNWHVTSSRFHTKQ